MIERQYTHGGSTLTLGWQFPAGMIRLGLINTVLRVLTLGLYHFWAKTEVRQRIWSAIRINDEPLTYTGRGVELFVGFLIVTCAIFLPTMLFLGVLTVAFGEQHAVTKSAILAIYIMFAVLYGMGIYRAQRYRLARTRWRGVRGALDGNSSRYGCTYFWTSLLVPLTLGWIIPWRATKLQSMITNHTSFGDQRWRFDARSGPLYGPFAVAWIGVIVICTVAIAAIRTVFWTNYQQSKELGITVVPSALEFGLAIVILFLAGFALALATSWYRTAMINHFAHHTHVGRARFHGQLTVTGMLWISVTNYLIGMLGVLCVGLLVVAIVFLTGSMQNPLTGTGNPIDAEMMPVLLAIVAFLGPSLMAPIILARSVGYVVRNLSLSGTLPIDEIAQSSGSDTRYGEGLAESFDVELV